jgi:hypothetical protein
VEAAACPSNRVTTSTVQRDEIIIHPEQLRFIMPQTSPHRTPLKSGTSGNGGGFSLLILLVIAGFVGWNMLTNWWYNRRFEPGMKAYTAGKCEQAIADFNEVIGDRKPDTDTDTVAQSIAKREECQIYRAFLTNVGKPVELLGSASEFAQKYPNSALLEAIRQSTNLNLDPNQVKSWAGTTACQKMDAIEKANLIPQNDRTLPELYQHCGDLLVSQKQAAQGAGLYEQFLHKFPKHSAEAAVKKAYAAVLVSEAKAKGSGTIAAPGQSGVTADGSTEVTIQNDSQVPMRIVFSGPTPRVEELPRCKDCQSYTTENAPSACPEKGPIGTYVLNPGDYEVLVKSYGGQFVRPFTGNWGLNAGTAYKHCFYIVQSQRSRY